MSLGFDLRVTTADGTSSLGVLDVQRMSHRDVTSPDPWAVYRYVVRLNGTQVGVVEHRYGDGPWALTAKATACAADWRSVISW